MCVMVSLHLDTGKKKKKNLVLDAARKHDAVVCEPCYASFLQETCDQARESVIPIG